MDLAPADIGRLVHPRISPILMALVYGGMIAWILPVIGTVWTGIAWVWARRYTGWIRVATWILFLLSLWPTAAVLLAE